MKYVIAYLPAWIFFWMGHAISRSIMNWGRFGAKFYFVYNNLMLWSLWWNNWGNLKIWGEPE